MGRAGLIAASALATLGLAACHNPGRGGSHICTPFTQPTSTAPPAAPGQIAPTLAADPAAVLDDCLHRWGYILAASPDRAEEAAQATLAACAGALTRWNQQGLAAGAPDATMTAPSLVTGQASNPIAEHFNYAQGRALFYVVQARAGKCAAPAAPVASAPR